MIKEPGIRRTNFGVIFRKIWQMKKKVNEN